ncbi:hypothetical protein [Bacillus pseudomycoides]|uniref:hypothetical protein n=1 Tax=Bacillus pseudomycoides TaxID=64104 RepID=UPI0011558FBE|nr:hypothetical protein [Bacillus pseudomycoides]
MTDLIVINNYFIKPLEKDEECGFTKAFYKDIQKIVVMKSEYKSKIFATYFNASGNIFYDSTDADIDLFSVL